MFIRKKSELERIKGELPESVKNAVFSSEVCIKSVYYSNEYLYPASDYLSHDRDRRRVFTWRPGAKIVHVNGKLRIVDLLARSVMYNIVLQKKLSVIYLMIMHQTIHRKVTK
ncbi:hypothetical protein [Wolbachia pipientis]|uniref:hypothetical protein n=1 Tax=Wolbachia pipientis TaxID=955 RepID=UPI00217503C0|nr:hypothetical protein [Wolbachia pipientis]